MPILDTMVASHTLELFGRRQNYRYMSDKVC